MSNAGPRHQSASVHSFWTFARSRRRRRSETEQHSSRSESAEGSKREELRLSYRDRFTPKERTFSGHAPSAAGGGRSGLLSASSASSIASFRQSRRYTRCPVTVSTPKPEGGARCDSSARRDLCGGRGAILVPTATKPLYFKRRPRAKTSDGSSPNILRKSLAKWPRLAKPHLKAI